MATSRPLKNGDFVISLLGGGWAIWRGQDIEGYVLGSDFGLPEWRPDYWESVCMRVYGLTRDTDTGIAAAITNGTAPGLYVREGDDTSDWETYRQVLARRVEEAMAARRGGETMTATTRQGDEIRVGDVVEVVSNTSAYTTASDVGGGGRVTRIEYSSNVWASYVDLESYAGLRLPVRRCVGLPDISKILSPPQTVAANVSPMPDGVAEGIEAAVTDEVWRRGVVDDMRRASADETIQPARRGSLIGQAVRREIDRLYGRTVASPPTTAASPQPPPSPPSRFSLLEVDVDTDVSPAPAPQALKAPVDLAALQQELRAEREAKRALAAAQTPPGRFDLLECDLPAVPASKPAKAPQQRPAASSSPPRRPVETITDLTVARSPLELARMLEGLNDELSTMMRRREVN